MSKDVKKVKITVLLDENTSDAYKRYRELNPGLTAKGVITKLLRDWEKKRKR